MRIERRKWTTLIATALLCRVFPAVAAHAPVGGESPDAQIGAAEAWRLRNFRRRTRTRRSPTRPESFTWRAARAVTRRRNWTSSDLVIRANPDPSTDLAGRCFLRDVMVVVAAPSLPRPAGRSDAVVPAITLSRTPRDATWQLSRARSVRRIATHTVLRLSSMAMIHDAALAGVGAAAMPRSLVQADIDAGRLLDWGVPADHPVEVWALYPSHRHLSARVAAFVKLLLDRFENASPKAFARLAGTR